MKRIGIIILIVVWSIQVIRAAQIDVGLASKVARNFYLHQRLIGDNHSIDLKLVKIYNASIHESVYDSSDLIPLFYVYNINDNEGFVMVAADDNSSPILAYSLTTGFSQGKLPPACRELLVNYQKVIAAIKKNKFLANDDILKKWTRLNNGVTDLPEMNSSSVSPLLTTTWDQGTYYNALCPYDSFYNASTYTGCVATAMAQIMKFWNYPSQGLGFHSYIHPIFGIQNANFAGTTYDWAAMPDNVTIDNNAVATLMYHCGVSIDMNYGVAVSTAFMFPVVYALTAYFQYSGTAQCIQRSNYSNSAWIQLLKNELDAGRPIQYSGNSGTSIGHSFVCDGYDNNDFFHFNWGWSGSSDAYFNISNLNPAGNTYNDNQWAIIGIQPANGVITTTQVTFTVDMAAQTISPDGVHLAGNFQGWNPSSTLMTSSGGSIYSCTIELMAGTLAEYKFINGTTWAQSETVPATCNISSAGNRYYTVPNASIPVLLPYVCFSSCSQCTANVNVTFKVDMTGQSVPTEGIHLAGNFQNWDPASCTMLLQSDNIYTFTTSLMPGTQAEYKFINGNTWGQVETVPSSCALAPNGNRYITIPFTPLILPAVLFDNCFPQPSEVVNVTFKVSMGNELVSNDGIHLASDFQEWNPETSLMTNTGFGIFQIIVPLQSGSYHEYKFINGNHWGVDESVPTACSHNNNRYITVPSNDTVINPIVFSTCDLTNSMNEISGETYNLFSIFPNPGSGNITLTSKGKIRSIEICNVFGELIYLDFKSDLQDSKEIDLTNYSKGIYFIKVQIGTMNQSKKIVVQ